jgi:hypothetical protein
LRLETAPNFDKKKSELYFLALVKKFLTENPIKRPENDRNFSAEAINLLDAVRHFRATTAAAWFRKADLS